MFGQPLAQCQLTKSTRQTPAGRQQLVPTRCGCSWAARTPLPGWKPWARRAAWSAVGKRWIWPARTRRGFLSTLCRNCARSWAPRWYLRSQPVTSHNTTAHNEKQQRCQRGLWTWWINAQAATSRNSRVLHEDKKVTLHAECVHNLFWQPELGVVSLAKRGSALCSVFYLQVGVGVVRVSVRRRCVHVPLLRQNGFYRSVELVFIHYDAGVRFLIFQTHVEQSDKPRGQLVTVRCALCAGLSATPPRMESSAAWGRGDTTSSKSLPQTISRAHWWLEPLCRALASSHEPRGV